MTNISGVSQQQNVAFEDQRDDIPPADSNYIPNTDEPAGDNLETSDSSSVNSPSGSSPTQSSSGTNKSQGKDDNYLDNSSEYHNAVDGSSGSDPINDAADSINSGDEAVDDVFGGLDDNDFVNGGEDGYQDINGEKLARILSWINRMTNLELGIHMLVEASIELSEKIREIVLEITKEEGEEAVDKSRFFKTLKERLKLFQKFILALYKRVYSHNLEFLKKRHREIEDQVRNDASRWDKFCDWFDDRINIEIEEKKLAETLRFNQSVSKNLAALKQALGGMIAMYCSSDKAELRGLGGALKGLDEKIEEANRVLDQPVTHSSDYFDEDDMKNMFQDILREIRSKMVAVENMYRAILFLQTAQKDISDSIRESVLEISAHSSKAEYAYLAYEGASRAVNIFFDLTYNTLMTKVSFHNNAIQQAKNVEKLKDARGWRIAGRILIVNAIAAAIAASIIITVMSCGTFAPGVIAAWTIAAGALSATAAASGIIGGVLTGVGMYYASQSVEDNFDASSPDFTFDLLLNRKKTGNSAADAIDKAEEEEEMLARYAGSINFLDKTKDGFFVLNEKALAALEIRQKSLQNIIKFIMHLAKAQRDLSRTVTAIVLEKAIKDHGEGYLLSNTQNSIHQRQLLTQAIKFQLQEKVTAKNIARQNDLMAERALWSSLSGAIGAGVGALCCMIPGVGWALGPLLIGVGAALGSATYALYDTLRPDSAYGMTYTMDSEDFHQILESRKRNAKSSGTPEDKLHEIEDKLYAQLLEQGLVGVGDGYQNVNFVLAGKIYHLLMKIQLMREMLTKLRAAQAKISAAVRQLATGTGNSFTEFGQIQSEASFSQALGIAKTFTRALQEQAAVHNRARDAEKALTMAGINFGVNVGLAVAGVSLSAASTAVGATVSGIARSLTVPLMSLSNAITGLVMNAQSAQEDYGYYKGFEDDSEKAVKEIRGDKAKADEKADVYTQLAALENMIYVEAGKNLAKTLHGATLVVDGEKTGILSDRMQNLNNLRKMLYILLSAGTKISKEVRQKLKVGGAVAEGVEDIQSIHEQATQRILNSLMQGVEVVTQRKNQISAAHRQMIISSISVGLSVASLVLGTITAVKSVRLNEVKAEYQKRSMEPTNQTNSSGVKAEAAKADTAETPPQAKGKTTEAGASKVKVKVQTPAAKAEPEVKTGAAAEAKPQVKAEAGAAKTQPKAKVAAQAKAQTPAKASKSTNGRPGPGKSDKVSEPSKERVVRKLSSEYKALSKSIAKYEAVSLFAALASTFLNYYAGSAYDADNDEKEASVKSSALDTKKPSRGRDAGKKEHALKETSSESEDIFSTLNDLDADASYSEIMISKYSTASNLDIILKQADELMRTWLEGVKGATKATGKTIEAVGLSDKAVYARLNKEAAAPTGNLKLTRDSLNQLVNIYANKQLPLEEASNYVQSLPQKVNEGKVNKEVAIKFLNKLQAQRPELKPVIEKVLPQLQSVAAGASVAPSQVAQPQRSPEPFKPEQRAKSSSKGAREYAQKLIRDFQAKCEQAAKKIKVVKQQVVQTEQTLKEIKNVQRKDAQIGTQGTQVAKTPADQLQALRDLKARLQQQMDGLNQELKNLMEKELPQLENRKVEVLHQVESRLKQIDSRLKEMASKPKLTSEEKKEYDNLKAEKDMLHQVKNPLDNQMKALKQNIAHLKQRLATVRSEMQGVGVQIARVTREIERNKEKLRKKLAAKGVSQGQKKQSPNPKISSLGFTGNSSGNGKRNGYDYGKLAQSAAQEEDVYLSQQREESLVGGLSC